MSSNDEEPGDVTEAGEVTEADAGTHDDSASHGDSEGAAIARGDGEGDAADETTGGDDAARGKSGRRISVSLRALGFAAIVAVLVVAVGVMTWLYMGAESTIKADAARTADAARAEKTALDYAVDAAIMDFKDLGPWKQNLVKGTTPELNAKLTEASTAMEQLLLPLQWTSTAKPLAAKVRSDDNGVYVVDAFVSVMTKTVQAADNLQSTATYSITIDSNNNWLISDVGGIAAVVGDK
ncbi:hypothetical protein [Mycolicibacterium porcinum]|uniref:hypothetical protein n=1 Tax=Mycolicibacterium porcinum TaxID=39693 RepID=UPI0004350BB2|nr:hypothetical protein [Mycolicibacterium porcinum]ORB39011.1 hypothetical protein BST41_18515 [Mycolicibacterium porcinum]CDO30834.1 hypothetical protein BN979_03644 [Mycolicibacterium vulneris]